MVEHNLAKVGVASSNLVSRSRFENLELFGVFLFIIARLQSQSLSAFAARWQSGYAAACKAAYAGSIPTLASIHCPGGGIGRRSRLKICRPYGCTGSIPVLGTNLVLFFSGKLHLGFFFVAPEQHGHVANALN